MFGLSGPAIHIGIALAAAFLLKLNPIVTVFCGILPDLVDKPLAMFGIAGGRYVGHSLIFAVVVIIGFYLWKRRFGFSALVGLGTRLVLDLTAPIPWFYPFIHYNFSSYKFDLIMWIKEYLSYSEIGIEFIILISAISGALLIRYIYQLLWNKTNKEKD